MPPVWVRLLARRRHASHSVGGIWIRQTSAMRNGHAEAAAQRPAGSVFVSPGGVVHALMIFGESRRDIADGPSEGKQVRPMQRTQ